MEAFQVITPVTHDLGDVAVRRTLSAKKRTMLGGEAFPKPRHVWWNFVSSSRDRINTAKSDWKAGHFPTIPGDDKEWNPIPEVPLTQSD